jgi:ligand-binding sensor domain-containing protein
VRNIIHIAFFCILAWSAMGQKPHFRAHALPEEFAHNRIQQFLQSSAGYIWLGCSDGLFRFDGHKVVSIAQAEPEHPFSVRSLYEDKNGRLWAGLESGEVHFLSPNGKLQLWDPEEGHPQAPVVAFAEDHSGAFWIATYGEGLYCLKNGRLYNFSAEDGLGGDEIYDMAVDTLGQIWCGTDRGIYLVGWDGERKTVRRLGKEAGLPDEIVRIILADDRCGIWAGMYDGGLCRFDPITQQVDYVVPDWPFGVVTALACFHHREVWIGTEGNGLLRLDLETGKLESLSTREEGPGSRIYDLTRDDEGIVWAAGSSRGFFSANRHFEFVKGSPADIQAVLAGRQGGVWVGAQQGIYRKQKGAEVFEQMLPGLSPNVVSLYEDNFGNVWIGTFGEGVIGFQPSSGKTLHIREGDRLVNGSVLSIDGRDSVIWLATLGGVSQWTLRGNPLENGQIAHRAFDQESGLGSNYIYKVMVDKTGRTWFGTDGKGVSVWDDEVMWSFPNADTMPLRAVYSLAEDGQGNIWLSTSGQGLFRFNGQRFFPVSLKEGIRNLAISGIANTANGQLLIVHRNGLDLLDPETGHLIYYDQESGIPEAEPSLNAIDADVHGDVWIGLPESLIRFSSLEEPQRIHPITRIEQVFLLMDTIDWQVHNDFGFRQNFLVFDYVGIWYTDPGSVTYRYMLEGYDRDWIYTRDQRATYSNLPPGRYTFKVSSTENGVFAGEPVVEYAFRIRPPLWLRPWFILLAIMVGGVLAFLFVKNRESRMQRLEKLKQESIRSQYEALKSQINPHFLFNSFNTLISFIEENPALAVEYVERLSDFYRVILAYREKERITLEEELRLVRDFGYLLEKRFGQNFALDIRIDKPAGYYVAPLALQILVENAVKHNVVSKAKPLRVRIEIQADGYLLVANSLQPKLTAEPSTGFGLSGIIDRYSLLTERPVLVEKEGEEFCVKIPLLT